MLANNPVTHDTRVIKCAESLAASGMKVTVLCREEGAAKSEVKQGVIYERTPFITTPRALLKKLRYILFNLPKKGFHFSGKSISLLSITFIFDLLAAALLVPLGLVEKRLIKNRPSYCLSLLNRLLYKPLLHPYITFLTFSSLYESTLSHKPDVIHAHDIDTLMLAAITAKAHNIPYIYDAHEYESDRVDRKGTINQMLIRFDEAKYIKNARVITVADGIAELLVRDYGIPKPTITYNAPITANIASTKGQTIKKVLKLKESDFLVVYVGFVTITRCLTDILKALPYTEKVHFACIGPQYQPMVEELQNTAASINQTDYFHLLPAVPYHEVSYFISSADAGIVVLDNLCTSYEHAMPNKFFETLCAGLPMIMSSQNEMRALAETYKLGIFTKSTSPEEIAKAISKLQAEYKIYAPSEAKTATLRETFGWEAQEQKLLSLYRDIFIAPTPQLKTPAIDSQ